MQSAQIADYFALSVPRLAARAWLQINLLCVLGEVIALREADLIPVSDRFPPGLTAPGAGWAERAAERGCKPRQFLRLLQGTHAGRDAVHGNGRALPGRRCRSCSATAARIAVSIRAAVARDRHPCPLVAIRACPSSGQPAPVR